MLEEHNWVNTKILESSKASDVLKLSTIKYVAIHLKPIKQHYFEFRRIVTKLSYKTENLYHGM